MAALLPLLFLLLSAGYFGAVDEARIAALKAVLLLGVATAANTELLSLARVISTTPLAIAWLVECGAVITGLVRRRRLLATRLRSTRVPRPEWQVVALIAPAIAIVALTFVTALLAPPNTYDAMTYHMARVAHWAADGSVSFYPTNVTRQLYEPPWAEYAALQLQLLSGGDRLANLVQWFCSGMTLVAVSHVAKQLNARPLAQAFSACLVATLPMGILQSSSTQNDYVVTLWLVSSVSFATQLVARPALETAWWLAASAGLAALTKSTAYLFLAPLVVVIGWWILLRHRHRVLPTLALLVIVPTLLNGGVFIRNEALFHDPLGPAAETATYVNQVFGPQTLASNLVRDSVLQFGTTSPELNQLLERAVGRLHRSVLHVDVNDPRTTWPTVTFAVNPTSLDEDYAGDPLQALLAAICIVGAVLQWRRSPLLGLYAAGITAAFILFAVYLRWQPWHSRLELPLLVATGPLVAVFLARRVGPAAMLALAALLFFASLPWVIDNQNRPLVGFEFAFSPRTLPAGETVFNASRSDLYFAKAQGLEDPYTQVASYAQRANCTEVALWAGANDWEYPLWPVARARVDQVFVHNASVNARQFGARPCLLVATVPNPPPSVVVDGVTFTEIWAENGVTLYGPTSL